MTGRDDPSKYVGDNVTKEWQEYRDAQNKKHAEERAQYNATVREDPSKYVGDNVTKEWQEYRDAQNKKHAEERARTVREDPSKYVGDNVTKEWQEYRDEQNRKHAEERARTVRDDPGKYVGDNVTKEWQEYRDEQNRKHAEKRRQRELAAQQQMMNSPFLDPKGTAERLAREQQMRNSGSITSPEYDFKLADGKAKSKVLFSYTIGAHQNTVQEKSRNTALYKLGTLNKLTNHMFGGGALKQIENADYVNCNTRTWQRSMADKEADAAKRNPVKNALSWPMQAVGTITDIYDALTGKMGSADEEFAKSIVGDQVQGGIDNLLDKAARQYTGKDQQGNTIGTIYHEQLTIRISTKVGGVYSQGTEKIDYEYHIVNGKKVLLEVSSGNEAIQDVLYDNYA